MLKDKFAAIEEQMQARLEEIRRTHEHAGSKGQGVEEVVRRFLREYLPRRLDVGHGEVVDSEGGRSPQTDVVIVTDDHPFTFTHDLPGLFFVEGISAAGEVKTTLNQQGLKDAIDKAHKFKKLQPKRAKGTLAHANVGDLERFVTPPYFLVAFESAIPLDTISRALTQEGSYGTGAYEGNLDGVFVLDRGWAMDFGLGTGSLVFRSPEGTSIPGWIYQESDSVLFDFLGWLSSAMIRTFRFEPILPLYLGLGADS